MDVVTLDGGVDLAHSPTATPAGKLRECFNYEVGWSRGYARVDGFERFDGQVSPSSTTVWVVELDGDEITGTDSLGAPNALTWTLGDDSGDAGFLVQEDDIGDDRRRLFIVFRDARRTPPFGATISSDGRDSQFVLTEPTGAPDELTVTALENFSDDHADYLLQLRTNAGVLRDEIRPVPGGGTIVGLHWHEDRLYAVRDVQTITVSASDRANLVTGMYVYNASDQIGQIVEIDEDTNRVEIAPVTDAGFSLSASDTINIALQFRFEDGSAPEFVVGEVATVPVTGTFTVGYVATRASDWTSGGGKGDMVLIDGVDEGEVAPSDVVTGANGGSCTAVAEYFSHKLAAATVVTASTSSRIATLWRSSDDGWENADVSRILRFVSGTVDPFSTTPVQVNQELTLGRAGGLTDDPVTGWFANGQAGSFPTVAELTANMQADDGDYGRATVTGQLYPGGPSVGMPGLRLGEFQLTGGPIPSVATVSAVSIGFRIRADDPDALLLVALDGGGSPTEQFEIPTVEDLIWVGEDGGGDPVQTWNKNWVPSDINNGTFTFRIGGRYPFGGGANTSVTIDEVRAKVRYEFVPGSTLYLYNGSTDIGTVQLTEAVVESGAWDNNNAVGFFILEDWDIVSIPAGTSLYTGPGGTGLLVAATASDVIPVNLPGSEALAEERARYQFISYNFFATEERNAIYGCSGAGPAFVYEPRTNKLTFISTGVEGEEDKPRHVSAHLSRLALGYKWGEVYVSAPGEPTNFSGVDFAATFGFGDKITGLSPTAGDATAVFTENSTWMLVGAAGDDANPARQQVVNARVGAIEYTVQSSGNRPIFASFRGIETLETTEQFGEFFTAPMTYDVSPWLLERLQTAAGLEATDRSVVNSVVVRNKNQYRLFFADGYVLTLSQVGVEKTPQSTIQYYYFNSDFDQYARVFATASGVTTEGRERVFMSVEEAPAIPANTPPELYLEADPVDSSDLNYDYVYELDKGRSFDGGVIKAAFTLFYNFGSGQQNTMATARYNVMHMHGRGAGYSLLRVSRAMNYEDIDNPPQNYEAVTLASESMPPETEMKAKYTKSRLSGRGFALSLRVESESDKEFPHLLQQVTLLDDEPMRLNR